jgi:hypothetical protein
MLIFSVLFCEGVLAGIQLNSNAVTIGPTYSM